MTRIMIILALGGLIYSQASSQPVGLDFYDNLNTLPIIYDNVESYYVSSYDRTGGNDDGFRGTHSQLYIDDQSEHVIFDADGPGCIYNFWFTGSGANLHWGTIKIYIDGQKTPIFEAQDKTLFLGENRPFVEPLVTNGLISSGGFSCSAPIPFQKHLKITTEKSVGFYNIYYQLYKNVEIQSWTPQQDYSGVIDLFQRCGSDPTKNAEHSTVVRSVVRLDPATGRNVTEAGLVSIDEPGTIQSIKINPLFKPDTYTLNHTHLRVYYDGAETPSVDVPIGPLFGSGLGEADVRSLFAGMSSSGTYYCYFPMPFQQSIRITLQNLSHDGGGEYACQVSYTNQLPKTETGALGYFGAKYNCAWPIVDRADYVLFEYQGRGAVLGQVMTVEPVMPDRKRWWEGDLRIYIDGDQKPRFHGTGHEDEYQGGWSTFWLTNPYSLPLFGEPKTENLINVFGQVNGSTTAYRFWPGKIHFKDSIKISTEHGNQNDTPANYSSLVYYYFIP
ncbi:MAG: DUF2961 domain-containing protein [Pirellulales bacterium]|nr:DUF2961 domain-containing protein [Pirellulales bacterium]